MSYIYLFRIIEFLYGTVVGTFAVNTLFLQSNSLNASTVGIIISLSSLAGAAGSILGGAIADKIQSRYMVFCISTIGTGLFAFLLPLYTNFNNNVFIIAFLLSLNRFCSSSTYTIIDSIIMNAQRKFNKINYSTMRMFQSIGYSLICVAFTPIINIFGVNMPYIITALLCIILLIIGKNLQQFDETYSIKDRFYIASVKNKLEFKELFKNYYLIILLTLNLLIQFPNQITQFIPYLLSNIGIDSSSTALISGLRVIGEISILFFAPYIKKHFSNPMLLCISAVCFFCESLLYTLCKSFISIVIVNLLGGIGYGLLLAGGVDLVFSLAPKGLESTVLALYGMSSPLIGVISAFIGGIVIDRFSIKALYYVSSGLMIIWLISFLTTFFLKKKFVKKPVSKEFIEK